MKNRDYLRFGDRDAYFKMTLIVEESNLNAKGDIYVAIDIASGQFSGKNDLWIRVKDFTSFCRELNDLNTSLNGEALLQSASPDELSLRVFAADSRGSITLEATTGYSKSGAKFGHSVTVGFSVELQQLSEALSLPWVRKRL
ncbi:MAG TPA: hypothetical protein PKE66_14125 [Pyrinomonadaceae bacterium]|nr:hypothetical protein [Pyrinomonadaceae bacterium]